MMLAAIRSPFRRHIPLATGRPGARIPHYQHPLSTSTSPDKQKRIPRTLYRQLLRWCSATDSRIPLDAFIDPIVLVPPQLDEGVLVDPASHRAFRYLPAGVQVSPDGGLRATVRNSTELRALIRAIFRWNSTPAGDDRVNRERVTYGFQTIRTLNELTEQALNDFQHLRESHSHQERSVHGVQFHVGQVVQHKQDRWRGVVLGWEKPLEFSNDPSKPLSSLTTKVYTAGEFLNSVRYEILLDAGDVHTMRATAAMITCTQNDLELLQDSALCRIRSSFLSHHFQRYDATSRTFVMNDMLAYEYPADHELQKQTILLSEQQTDSELEEEEADYIRLDTTIRNLGFEIGDPPQLPPKLTNSQVEVIAKRVAHQIQTITQNASKYILRAAADGRRQNQGDHEKIGLLLAFGDKLRSRIPLFRPDVFLTEDTDPVTTASAHVRHFLNFILELRQVLDHRQKMIQAHRDKRIQFQLGQVVYHKFFHFRGVVVGMDPKAAMDVSGWDGVRHLKHLGDPGEFPFYYVLPDQDDCQRVFGEPRGMRYVCQENMEPCQGEQCAVSIQVSALDPGWTQQLAADGTMTFVPPSHIKFNHGLDTGDNNLTEESLTKLDLAILRWEAAARDAKKESFLADLMDLFGASDPSPETRVSLEDLMCLLRAAPTMEAAVSFEESIKDIFKSHPDKALRTRLDDGITEMIRGKIETPLKTFQGLAEEDCEYGDAWNKVSACQYMLGQHKSALEMAKKAVALIPMNFQIFSGAGLCEYEEGNYENAAALFRYCLRLNPWSPVATKLAACQDMLNRKRGEKTEESDSEK